MSAARQSVQDLIHRNLYRTLLRAAKPFTSSSYAAVLTCLLHRTGADMDDDYSSFLRDDVVSTNSKVETPEFAMDIDIPTTTSNKLFYRLLGEVISGSANGIRQMNFPGSVDTSRIWTMVRREFRGGQSSLSRGVGSTIRRQTAFLALKELNKKLAWYEMRQSKVSSSFTCTRKAALGVQPLSISTPSNYLRPGCFLVAHPHLSGYFRRTVIVILDDNNHKEYPTEPAASSPRYQYGTYGLVINRVATAPLFPLGLALRDILRPLPNEISAAFSNCIIHEGGPVHMSLQMLHCVSDELHEECQMGGQLLTTLPRIVEEHKNITNGGGDSSNCENHSACIPCDDDEEFDDHGKALYFGGDVSKAAKACISSRFDHDKDVTFFVGASSWEIGQLQSEIERGYWLPVRGPISMAFKGIAHLTDDSSTHSLNPSDLLKPDLWLSIMSACGPTEAAFARLLFDDDGQNEMGSPCDDEY